MQVDREYNACKALDPQIDNEDDVHHSSPYYETNEQELQTQMWLGGLHGCNEWAGRTRADGAGWGIGGRSGLRNRGRGGLRQTGRIGADGADWDGLGRTGRTGRTGVDEADGAEGGVLDRAWRGVRGGLGSLGRACQRIGRTGWDAHV